MTKVFSSTGVTTGTYSDRLAVASPYLGQQFYQTDTDELLKYVTDLDTQNRWMQADHDYSRNLVVNGSFAIWQRGASFNPVSATTTTGLNYGADRWQMLQATTNGATAAYTRTAITSTDPAGYNYYCRVQRTSAQTFTTAYTLQTSFESTNIQAVRGKYVTLSFWARAGANYSAASGFLVSNIVTGTGTDNTAGNFTTNTVNTTANNVLTTSWKRFSITTSAAIATTITQLGISFVFTPVGTAGAADYYDITGVQLETGTAPSDFEQRDVGDELRRCQRYYERSDDSSRGTTHTLRDSYWNASDGCISSAKSGASFDCAVRFTVLKRVDTYSVSIYGSTLVNQIQIENIGISNTTDVFSATINKSVNGFFFRHTTANASYNTGSGNCQARFNYEAIAEL